VYPITYGFSLGETGLAFISVLVRSFIALAAYVLYFRLVDELRIAAEGIGEPEQYLFPGMIARSLLPLGLSVFSELSSAPIYEL